VALLALYATMSLSASLHKGASFDEQEELAVGYNIWLHHDFRMEGANGDLIKRWATLPYLVTPRPTMSTGAWRGLIGTDLIFSIRTATSPNGCCCKAGSWRC
jgi:hypothetical protein